MQRLHWLRNVGAAVIGSKVAARAEGNHHAAPGPILALSARTQVMLDRWGRTMGRAVIGCTLSRVVLASAAGPRVVKSSLLSPKATFQSLSVALVRSNFQRLPRLSPA